MATSIPSKAAVVVGPKRPIEFWNSEVPPPPRDGINVRVTMAGVCGTDVHIWQGDYQLPFAHVLGHEGIGTICQLGEDVTTDHADQPVAVGDLVYWCPVRPCYSCSHCTVKRDYPSCEKSLAFTTAHEPTAASYTTIASLPKVVSFYKTNPSCPPEAIIALGCALPAVLQGLDHIGGIPFNSTVVIQGSGAIGLAAVMQASLAGARKIIVIEAHPVRLHMAQRFGATDVINLSEISSKEDRLRRVQEITGAPGVDVVIEATGRIEAFEEGLGLLQRMGQYLLVGMWAGDGLGSVNPFEIVRKALRIVGTTYAAPHHYYQALKLAEMYHTRFPLADCVTHRFTLEETVVAFETIRKGEVVKAIVEPAR